MFQNAHKIKGRPNHDHNYFWVHLAGPYFSFLGCPRMTHQMRLLHSGTQRNHKDFSSDMPSNAVLVWHQMQNFFGRLWLWLCSWKATKEYLNQKGTKIGVFRVWFRAPSLPPFSLHFFPPVSPPGPIHSPTTSPLSPPPLLDSRKTPI